MHNAYTPRRASARWRDDTTPAYVLDCFDNKGQTADRYTVLFTGELLMAREASRPRTFGNTLIQYLGLSDAPTHPQGFSQWGEMEAWQAANYRYHNGKHRVRWLDLPANVREHIIARCTE